MSVYEHCNVDIGSLVTGMEETTSKLSDRDDGFSKSPSSCYHKKATSPTRSTGNQTTHTPPPKDNGEPAASVMDSIGNIFTQLFGASRRGSCYLSSDDEMNLETDSMMARTYFGLEAMSISQPGSSAFAPGMDDDMKRYYVETELNMQMEELNLSGQRQVCICPRCGSLKLSSVTTELMQIGTGDAIGRTLFESNHVDVESATCIKVFNKPSGKYSRASMARISDPGSIKKPSIPSTIQVKVAKSLNEVNPGTPPRPTFTPTATTTPQRIIPDMYTNNDVLCGQGTRTRLHPGNQVYLELKRELHMSYMTATTKKEKNVIANHLIDLIHSRGGRFMKLDKRAQRWFEIDHDRAMNKTKQALRESN